MMTIGKVGRQLVFAAVVLGSFALTMQAVAATPPGQRCSSSKRKAAGKCVAALLGCYAKSATTGEPVDTACLSKATTKLTDAFGKAELRGGCITVGDAPSIVAFLSSVSFTAAVDLASAAEVCNNGVDDDGDTFIDCADPDCAQNPLCPVVNQTPVAQIDHPGDGEMRSASVPVAFVGVANDTEDGALGGTSMVWKSSLDGTIGTGTSFSATLSVGMHTITLTATDSSGESGGASIALDMTP